MGASRIVEFDLWRGGYGGSVVNIYLAGTITLASVYFDEAMTLPATNPQTLATLTIGDIVYGKFSQSLYINVPYYLDIVSQDQTGVIRPPLTTLNGADASLATVVPTGGATAYTEADLHGRLIYAIDTTALGVSAATNSATITTAMGRAAAAGGGRVILPSNTAIVFNQLTIPDGVILTGSGRSGSPTILQSQIADKAITLGTGSGLENLVVDGVNNVANSIGVYSKSKNQTFMKDVLIKRFATGMLQIGGRYANWKDLYFDSCVTGADLRGSLDTANGDQWRDNSWTGGQVSTCTTAGIALTYVDKVVESNEFKKIGFLNNTGTGIAITGARYTKMPGCYFSGNTTNLSLIDNALTTVTDNTVVGFSLSDGSLSTGAVTFNGTCQDVVLDHVDIQTVAFTMTNMVDNVLFRNCRENSGVTFSGQGTRITRAFEELGDAPGSTVTTSNATPLAAWQITLQPGQVVDLEAKVIGVQRNGVDYGCYHVARFCRRPGSQLLYKAQSVNFTVGALLTGGTSGAVARIVADTDAGATGTLVVKDIIGIFLDNEHLSDSSGGSATCNGTLIPQNAALLGSLTNVEAVVETDATWDAAFAVNTGNIELQVTGAAGKTIDWTVNVVATVH
jgi:hypothetical protein